MALRCDGEEQVTHFNNANIVAESLLALINNNPASGSPRLDENAIDITLAFMLLHLLGKRDEAAEWLRILIVRLGFVFHYGRYHPISTDSIDDLISLECNSDDIYLKDKTTATSWIIPTLMGWSVILDKEEGYESLLDSIKGLKTDICAQLWHPTIDLYQHLYFGKSQFSIGETEAPIIFPDKMDAYSSRMTELVNLKRYSFFSESTAVKAGMSMFDFIACRHFRTPVPPALWYRLKKND
jgi:hypothetical protein